MSAVEKVIATLRLEERELAAHRFSLFPLRHPSSRPQEQAVLKARGRRHTFLAVYILGDWVSGKVRMKHPDKGAAYSSGVPDHPGEPGHPACSLKAATLGELLTELGFSCQDLHVH